MGWLLGEEKIVKETPSILPSCLAGMFVRDAEEKSEKCWHGRSRWILRHVASHNVLLSIFPVTNSARSFVL